MSASKLTDLESNESSGFETSSCKIALVMQFPQEDVLLFQDWMWTLVSVYSLVCNDPFSDLNRRLLQGMNAERQDFLHQRTSFHSRQERHSMFLHVFRQRRR